MSSRRDGGRAALSGFLFQLVVANGLVARAHCSDTSAGSEELEALVDWVGSARLHHEFADADLGVTNGSSCGLAQLKYSRQVPAPTIGPEAMMDIVRSLKRSSDRAAADGMDVEQYFLITNRKLGDGAKELIDAAQKRADHSLITRPGQATILAQIKVIPESELSEYERSLERFGAEHGAESQEISRGIDTLVGRVLGETLEQGEALVEKADLLEALVGHRRARSLRAGYDVVAQSLLQLDSTSVRPRAPVIRRSVLDELARVSAQHALIILHGKGGCGKTVTLYQWAKGLVQSLPPGSGAFTAVRVARETPQRWIANTVADWANLGPDAAWRRHDDADRALNRLVLANPGLAPPIIHLGLDGLDERIGGSDREDTVMAIVRWFWEEELRASREASAPRATLVVTGRNAKLLADTWVIPRASGFYDLAEMPYQLEVDRFSLSELLEVARNTAIKEIEYSIRAAAMNMADASMGIQEPLGGWAGTVGGAVAASLPANEGVVDSLRHPAMWRSLLTLSATAQREALCGHAAALNELSRAFLDRFYRKLKDRDEDLDLDCDQLTLLLHSVALQTKQAETVQHRLDGWTLPACSTGLVRDAQARKLWREACSAGVLDRTDAEHWRWWHAFVEDYLAGVSAAGMRSRQ